MFYFMSIICRILRKFVSTNTCKNINYSIVVYKAFYYQLSIYFLLKANVWISTSRANLRALSFSSKCVTYT